MKPHPLLYPFSLIYGLVVSIRNVFFDIGILKTVDVGVPVISIGNITAGGTGKTPIVQYVAKLLLDAGKIVAIISRGYGRTTNGTVVVCDGNSILADSSSSGDEPAMIARNLKRAIVIVDEDRVRGAKKAVKEFGAEVIILDDGFQHRYLKRTKDIVLLDAEQMPFDTMLLPAGYRRELLSSLKRADVQLITKAKIDDDSKGSISRVRIGNGQQKFSSSFRPSGIKNVFGDVMQSLEILKGHTAVAFCGIAKPENFRMSLETCGVVIKELLSFPDHHLYTESEMTSIIESFHQHKADFILTTEKDAVRLQRFENLLKELPIAALVMEVTIHQQDAWKKYLLS
ncbi:MAG: tetraacyldisaccharide 4'-kinase [Bacteroidota bacterium]